MYLFQKKKELNSKTKHLESAVAPFQLLWPAHQNPDKTRSKALGAGGGWSGSKRRAKMAYAMKALYPC